MSKLFFWLVMLLTSLTVCQARTHDPTKPPLQNAHPAATVQRAAFQLQSILIAPKRRLAMINEQTLGIGNTVQGARLIHIDKNHVLLSQDGHIITLELFSKVTRTQGID